MLADKDRIFTNLYGYQLWTVVAARKFRTCAKHDYRGDW